MSFDGWKCFIPHGQVGRVGLGIAGVLSDRLGRKASVVGKRGGKSARTWGDESPAGWKTALAKGMELE